MLPINDAVTIKRLTKIAVERFDADDWEILAHSLDGGQIISEHPRLLRSLFNNDPDYPTCVAQVFKTLAEKQHGNLARLIDYIQSAHGIKVYTQSLQKDREDSMNDQKHCLLFISHKAEEKETAMRFKSSLALYGIESFVAHVDIEPTQEWAQIITNTLDTCDAFLYLASPSANTSPWCQQEIGWAFGRDIPMISFSLQADPVAFFAAKQSLHPKRKESYSSLAQSIVKRLASDPRTTNTIVNGLVDALSTSGSFDNSDQIAKQLANAHHISTRQANMIEEAITNNSQVRHANHSTLPEELRSIIAKHKNDG